MYSPSGGPNMITFGCYADARDFINTRRARRLGHNTNIRDYPELGELIGITYHYTDVVTYRPGSVQLNSGGWMTYTTKDRINSFLPSGQWDATRGQWFGLRASVWAQVGRWYLTTHDANTREERTYDFADGITLHDSGKVTLGHAGPAAPIADPDEDKRAYNRERYAERRDARARLRVRPGARELAPFGGLACGS